MDIQEALAKARDAATVSRVYGEPYERDGLTVIPAAAIGGGGGGGGGEGAEGEGSGGGFGYGVGARPIGAYVIDDRDVRWVPAPDVTRIATQALMLVATIAFLLLRRR